MASPLLLTNAMKGDIIMAQGEWKTINGAHVFIKDGQSVEDAFDTSGTSAKSGSIIVGKGEKVDNLPDDLPSIRKTVNPGKHSKTSEAYGNRIKNEFGIPNVDISRIDKQCAEDVYNSIKETFAVYPPLKNYVKSLVYDPNVKALSQWRPVSQELALGLAYANAQALETSYNTSLKKRKFVQNTTHKYIISHELGHAIDHMLTTKTNKFAFSVQKTICEEFHIDENYIIKNIASYAKEKPQEFFAMHFHEFVERKNEASAIAKRIMKILKETT